MAITADLRLLRVHRNDGIRGRGVEGFRIHRSGVLRDGRVYALRRVCDTTGVEDAV